MVVDHLGSEKEEFLLQVGGRVVEYAGDVGQSVEQRGVAGGRCGGGELAELGVDGGSFVFEFGEPLEYADAQRADGG